MSELAITFDSEGEELVGILHLPEDKAGSRREAKAGLVVVVGGPQYRVGSHRQFVLLARFLAERGVPVLRFDYRGMGDSGGDLRTFRECAPDIRAACDELLYRCPFLQSIALWGLCDGASAALNYAPGDPRVAGLVLCNPWVRTDSGEARAYVRHYYKDRIRDIGAWRILLRSPSRIKSSLSGLGDLIRKMRLPEAGAFKPKDANNIAHSSLPEDMRVSLQNYRGQILVVISERDLTGQEFYDLVKRSDSWGSLLATRDVTWEHCAGADHTFSRSQDAEYVAQATFRWMQNLHSSRQL